MNTFLKNLVIVPLFMFAAFLSFSVYSASFTFSSDPMEYSLKGTVTNSAGASFYDSQTLVKTEQNEWWPFSLRYPDEWGAHRKSRLNTTTGYWTNGYHIESTLTGSTNVESLPLVNLYVSAWMRTVPTAGVTYQYTNNNVVSYGNFNLYKHDWLIFHSPYWADSTNYDVKLKIQIFCLTPYPTSVGPWLGDVLASPVIECAPTNCNWTLNGLTLTQEAEDYGTCIMTTTFSYIEDGDMMGMVLSGSGTNRPDWYCWELYGNPTVTVHQ